MPPTKHTLSFVAALPGWKLASYCPPDDGETGPGQFFYDDIIAWQIDLVEGEYDLEARRRKRQATWTAVHVDPITISGRPGETSEWAIKTPEGIYDIPGIGIHDHEIDALKELYRLTQIDSKLEAETG